MIYGKLHIDNFPNHPERFLTESIGILPVWFTDWAKVGGMEDIDPCKQRMSWQAFIDNVYAHGGGWRNFSSGFQLEEDGTLNCPDDPPLKPMATIEVSYCKVTAYMYMYGMMCVKFSDGVFEVARLD